MYLLCKVKEKPFDQKFKKDISSGGEAEDVLNVLRNAGIGHDFESTIR